MLASCFSQHFLVYLKVERIKNPVEDTPQGAGRRCLPACLPACLGLGGAPPWFLPPVQTVSKTPRHEMGTVDMNLGWRGVPGAPLSRAVRWRRGGRGPAAGAPPEGGGGHLAGLPPAL